MALVLLAVLWLAVLIPSWLRRQAEFKSSASISDFRYHLRVLERRSPALVPPANRLRSRSAQPAGFVRPAQLGLVPNPGRPARPGARAGAPSRVQPHALPHPELRQAHGASARATASARQQTLRRRRQVLEILVALVVASLALGALPNLHLMWAVTAVAASLLAAYVALLVHLRNLATEPTGSAASGRELRQLAAERDLKVRFLPSPATTSLLRRSVGS